jgi:Protein of unknown function (DUF3667)
MSNLPIPARWICPSCRHENSALEYCPACGERYLDPHRLTLTGLAEQAAESLFHADGRIVRTVTALLFQPGRLTQAWMRGERRAWMAPFQLFLFLNVIFSFLRSPCRASACSLRRSIRICTTCSTRRWRNGWSPRISSAMAARSHN